MSTSVHPTDDVIGDMTCLNLTGDTPYPHREDATISLYWTDEGLHSDEQKIQRNFEYVRKSGWRDWERKMRPFVPEKKYRNYEDLDVGSDWEEVNIYNNPRNFELRTFYNEIDDFRCIMERIYEIETDTKIHFDTTVILFFSLSKIIIPYLCDSSCASWQYCLSFHLCVINIYLYILNFSSLKQFLKFRN
jgi:hypothetical protein